MLDILVNLMSCVLYSNDSMSFLKNSNKHCVVNTYFKNLPKFPSPYRFELLEGTHYITDVSFKNQENTYSKNFVSETWRFF